MCAIYRNLIASAPPKSVFVYVFSYLIGGISVYMSSAIVVWYVLYLSLLPSSSSSFSYQSQRNNTIINGISKETL